MSEIFRKKYYQCSSSSIYIEEVNCIHWKSHIDTCTHTCDLKLFENPKVTDCMKCKSRQSYSDDILTKDKETNQFTNITVRKTDSSFSIDKAKKYISAEASQILQGKVDDEIYDLRKTQCMGCQFRVNNISTVSDEIGWCTSCGCGIGSERTKLSVKLRMPALICPKGKFGAAMGNGFKISDATDSVKGIVSMIKNIVN
jgi:hypothetical protein